MIFRFSFRERLSFKKKESSSPIMRRSTLAHTPTKQRSRPMMIPTMTNQGVQGRGGTPGSSTPEELKTRRDSGG